MEVEVRAIALHKALPTIPILLLAPDMDVPLNLSQAIHQVHEEVDYDLTIDYTRQLPSPALSAAE